MSPKIFLRPKQQDSFILGIMSRFGLAVAIVLTGLSGIAGDWYVRPAATGSANGKDWSNAWALNGVNWSSVQPGDTVWLAGGTYSTTWTVGRKGTASNWIYIKRVTASDTGPAAANGWNSSFDQQVLIAPNSANVLTFTGNDNGSYVHLDGRTDSGIKMVSINASGSYNAPLYVGSMSTIHDATFVNVDFAGPDDGSNPNFAHLGNNAALTVRAVNSAVSGDPFNTISNLTFVSCRFHGAANLVTMARGQNILWDKCKFYDNVAIGTAGSVAHQNMFELITVGDLTLRNCEMWNWAVEGLMPYGSPKGPIYVFGCLWRDCYRYPSGSTVARVIEIFSNYQIVFYNNTFVNLPFSVYSASGGGSYAAGSIARNNIYWNCAIGALPLPMDYEFSSGSISGANSISSGSNPFVNYSGKDYRIVSTVGAKYPRDKGISVTAPNGISLTQDAFGVTRGSDGNWDIGAFEQGATSATLTVNAGADTALILPDKANLNGTVFNPLGTTALISWSKIGGSGTVVFNNSNSAATTASFSSAGIYTLRLTANVGAVSAFDDVIVTVDPAPPALGLSFSATNGTISSPFFSTGGYVSQSMETVISGGGRASYQFVVTNAGAYQIHAMVSAPSVAENSLFINIDAEPTDPTSIWDIPVTTSFEPRTVSWRGTGTDTLNEFNPKTFELTAGTHQLIIRGREANVALASIRIAPAVNPPSNLKIVSSN